METYIRKNIKGYYIEFSDPLDSNVWDGKIGTTYQDFLDGKWVHLNSEQVAFHVEHPYATIKEVLDCQLTPTPPRTLEQAKSEKIAQIEAYDDSNAVNGIIINKDGSTIVKWLTPNERSNYRNSIDAAEDKGRESVDLFIGDIPVTLATQAAKSILADIQLYADACFNVTKNHIIAVNALDNIEAVDAYDFETGYPPKVVLNL